MQCPKPDCMYLHELGDEAASFTKEEMQVFCCSLLHFLVFYLNFYNFESELFFICHPQAGKHQEYEQKLLQDLYKGNPSFLQNSGEKSKSKSGTSQRFAVKKSYPSHKMKNKYLFWPKICNADTSVVFQKFIEAENILV